VGRDATRGKPLMMTLRELLTLNMFYFRDVYEKYVGPFDGYIAWSTWVPKTFVTNKIRPIEK
jgi:hypothetical protein